MQPGQTVLVLGSAGAVGTVAAQAAQVAVLEGERSPPGADVVVTLTPGEDWAAALRSAATRRGAME